MQKRRFVCYSLLNVSLLCWFNADFDTKPQFFYQQNGAPPHFHHDVCGYLNDALPHRWIGRASQDDSPLLQWPPRLPNLSPCDFFLWG